MKCNRELERGNNRAIKVLMLAQQSCVYGQHTHLCFYQTVFRTGNEDEGFNFHEVRKLGWIELPDTDRIALFLRFCKKLADMGNKGKVRCYIPPLGWWVSNRNQKRRTDTKCANENTEDIGIFGFLDGGIAPHEHFVRSC